MEQYRLLLAKIFEYEQTEFWQDLSGADIFKMELNHHDYYVSIMGNGGLERGMVIYSDAKDLYSDLELIDHPDDYSDRFARTSGYRIYMNDGQLVAKNIGAYLELEKNKALSDYIIVDAKVGQTPMIPSEENCKLLIQLLDGIIKIVEYSRKSKVIWEEGEGYTLNSFTISQETIVHSTEDYPLYYTNTYGVLPPNIESSKLTLLRQLGTYSIGIYYLPFLDQETKKYPLFCAIYDVMEERFLEPLMISGDLVEELSDQILNIFIKNKKYPEIIRCHTNVTEGMLTYVAKRLNIEMVIKKNNILEDIYQYVCKQQ